MNVLRIKDENGNWISVPAIKGDKGDVGDTYSLFVTLKRGGRVCVWQVRLFKNGVEYTEQAYLKAYTYTINSKEYLNECFFTGEQTFTIVSDMLDGRCFSFEAYTDDTCETFLASCFATTGIDGKDGLTPYIADNGNWWIGDEDTGVSASGGGITNSIKTIGQTGDCDYVVSGIALTPAIAQAVAEASDGDTIYIKKPATLDPTYYDSYYEANGTDILVDKNITIIAESGVYHGCGNPGTTTINSGCVLTIDGAEIQAQYDCKRTVVGGYETARGMLHLKNSGVSMWGTGIIGTFENCQISTVISNPSVNIDPSTYSPVGGIDNKYINCIFTKYAEFIGDGGHNITDSTFELYLENASYGEPVPTYSAPVTINKCNVVYTGTAKISLSNMMSSLTNVFYYGGEAFETYNKSGCFVVNATAV